VIPAGFDYVRPASLDEALQALTDPDAKALAGGQSLIPAMKVRLARPSLLVDLRRLDLRGVTVTDSAVRIRALTTYDAAAHALAEVAGVDALRAAVGSVGDLQVRNAGTVGGGVAHGDPASDVAAAMLAHGATFTARSLDGTREVAAEDFFVGPFATALAPGELLVEIAVPRTGAGTGSAYASVEDTASGYPLAGAAVVVERDGDAIAACRIGLTGATGAPARLRAAEELLAARGPGADITPAIVSLELATDDTAYRGHLVAVTVARAAARAFERAGERST
jgi:carbon-monoxide dehydrogenase medium subunit